MRRGLLGVVLGGCVFACRGPLDVSVDAHYEAPRTAVRAQVVGLGRVHAGSDTGSDARVRVRLCPTIAGPEPIDLTLDPAAAQIRWTMQAHDGRAPWTWDQTSATLQARLREAGYPTVDPREVDELVTAIEGVKTGPKTTVLDGQSEVLTVLQTRIDREGAPRLPALAACP